MLSWFKLTCLADLTGARVMVKFSTPVIWELSLQDVANYHYHLRPKAGFYFPLLTLLSYSCHHTNHLRVLPSWASLTNAWTTH